MLGAGGAARAACFVIQNLGIINRTHEKAEGVVGDFPALKFEIVNSLQEVSPSFGAGVIVACVPADDFTEADIPVHLFTHVDIGALVEMAYRPPVTALMKVGSKCSR